MALYLYPAIFTSAENLHAGENINKRMKSRTYIKN